MTGNQKVVYVYDDSSEDEPLLMGALYSAVMQGGEFYSLI